MWIQDMIKSFGSWFGSIVSWTQSKNFSGRKQNKKVRKINLIIVHCSASDNPSHDDVSVIDSWHKSRGWRGVGYHKFIKKDGEVQDGRSEAQVGAHAKYYNRHSLGVCLSGLNHFTNSQMKSLEEVCRMWCEKHGVKKIDIIPHNQVNHKKTCPNFDLAEVVSSWNWH